MANSKPAKLTVESFGYHFVKEHQGNKEVTVLRHKDTGENFKYDVYGDKSKNEERYEKLGEAILGYLQDICLRDNLKLTKIAIPVEAVKTKLEGFFFMSEHAVYFKKLIILVHGGGAVRAGQWSRSVIINENLESGAMVPYVERALEEGYGLIITNGNHNRDSNNRPIQGSESAEDHFVYVWNKFIKDAKAEDIVIVAHSLGGEVVLHGLKNIDEAMRRIKAVAFTHSTHTTTNESMAIKTWLRERARNWVTSEKPLDAPVKINCQDDCDQVSAGTMKHTMTSHTAKDSIFDFFKEKLNENEDSFFVRPTQFRHLSLNDRPFKQDEVYKMTSSPRGLAVIVNMRNFEPVGITVPNREGSEFDVRGLEKLFKGLDFKTETIIDKTKVGLLDEFRRISSHNFGAYDCLVVCIMSHGDNGYFLARDGGEIEIQSIRDMFNNKNCETLCGKPKLFFVNACRGEDADSGVVVKESVSSQPKDPLSSSTTHSFIKSSGRKTTSENADMLTAFSSVAGYCSFRDKSTGTWFIKSLVKEFSENACKKDVEAMLTRVTQEVNSKGDLEAKQVPEKVGRLTKKVFFWPGMKF